MKSHAGEHTNRALLYGAKNTAELKRQLDLFTTRALRNSSLDNHNKAKSIFISS